MFFLVREGIRETLIVRTDKRIEECQVKRIETNKGGVRGRVGGGGRGCQKLAIISEFTFRMSPLMEYYNNI